MVIYDVYEELEKPDEREILFINRILDGKFGFSSFEEMEDIYHPSCNNKNDNCDVIMDGGSCVNGASIDMNAEPFEFEVDAKSHESNYLDVVSFEFDLDYNSFESAMVAEFVILSTNVCQVQKGDLSAKLCGCSSFYKDDVSGGCPCRVRIEDGGDWKIRCKMKGEQNLCEWMVMSPFDVIYLKFKLEHDYLKDLRTSPKLEGENDVEITMSYQQLIDKN